LVQSLFQFLSESQILFFELFIDEEVATDCALSFWSFGFTTDFCAEGGGLVLEFALELFELGLVETELIVELFDLIFQRQVESFHFDQLCKDFVVTCFEDFGLVDFLVHFLFLVLKFFRVIDEFLGGFVFFGQGDRFFFVDGVQKFEFVLDGFVQVFEEGT
jgi:hypothetical protein